MFPPVTSRSDLALSRPMPVPRIGRSSGQVPYATGQSYQHWDHAYHLIPWAQAHERVGAWYFPRAVACIGSGRSSSEGRGGQGGLGTGGRGGGGDGSKASNVLEVSRQGQGGGRLTLLYNQPHFTTRDTIFDNLRSCTLQPVSFCLPVSRPLFLSFFLSLGLRARPRGRRPSVGGMHGRCVRKDRLLLAAPGFLVFFLSLSLALSPFFPAFRSLSMSLCLPHPLPLGPSLFLLVLSLSICHDDDSDGDDDEDDDGDEDLRLTLRKGKVAVT